MLMIMKDVKGKQYKQFIAYLMRNCDRFAFVENGQYSDMRDERIEYIEQLTIHINNHFIEKKIQKEWATTELTVDTAYVFYYELNNETKDFLQTYSSSLFNWSHPELPEDLMFYRGEQCVLAVCSHEKFFYIDEELWADFSRV